MLCRHSHYSLNASPATLAAYHLLSTRRDCFALLTTHRTATTAASNSPCSQNSSILVKRQGTTTLWRAPHTFSHDTTHNDSTVDDVAVALQSGPAIFLKQEQSLHTPVNPRSPLLPGTQHAQPHPAMSAGTPRGRKKHMRKTELQEATATDDAVALIPTQVTQRAKQLGKLMTQQRPKRSLDKLETKYSAQIRQKLKKRFRAIVQEAAFSAHWTANPAGFLACLQDIELLLCQLFAPLRSESPPDYCCSMAATTLSVSQCIDCILPVLLTQQGNARNMVAVAEFLQDMMGMDGSQMFRCFAQEPSVLYLDVYSSLLPLQDLFQTLHWEPADYNQIIARSDPPLIGFPSFAATLPNMCILLKHIQTVISIFEEACNMI